MAMSNQDKEKKCLTVSGFCEAILSTAEFECSLEDILDKKAAEAKRAVWKMEIKRENKEEKRSEKDESMNTEEKRSENDESMNIEEKRLENDESMNIEEKRSENDESMNIEEKRSENDESMNIEEK
ncbi:golgin subfamily A member 6-like protein 26 [Mytilus edulis]|uniref:golgin subfamily A member 6-like protein 26 n=1 Tax=Mytilus edulis TaxID=6550 RepID=UPI0039EEE3C7